MSRIAQLLVALVLLFDFSHSQRTPEPAPGSLALGEVRGYEFELSARFLNGNPVGWIQWNNWSGCGGSCGTGIQTRRRECWETRFIRETNEVTLLVAQQSTRQGEDIEEGCFGFNKEAQGCALTPCQGTYLGWTPWSACTATCGSGNRFRTRPCQGPGECIGPASESELCALPTCYSWTQWTSYSACSSTCGAGQSFRSRRCAAADGTDAPSLSECPDPLNAGAFQSQPCNLGQCYSWTQWTAYSQCSSACGAGQSFRSRRCAAADGTDAPSLSECPDPLNVGAFQSQPCNLGLCYSWTRWTEFSACSATCGAGQSFRSRRCAAADGTDAPSLSECPDPLNLGAFQSQSCNLGPCYQYTEWTTWSSCSAQCGGGSITRSRRCVDIATNIDAPELSNCADPLNLGAFQSQPCNLGPCYSWTQWTSYSACSSTCGAGQSFRSRRCAATDGTDAPSLSECPDPLNTGAFQSRPCTLGPCYQFTEWTTWSSCSESCDDGIVTRTRRCVDIATNIDAPELSNCADPLNLGAFQSQPCNLGPCYSWTQWTSYSACSSTCGAGQSFRSRRCAAADGTDAPSLSECPDPLNTGAFQSRPCTLGPCYQFTEWTTWSSCAASCDDGIVTRTRRCVDIATNIDAPELSNCADPLNLGAFQSQPCNLGPCYSWTRWSEYSQCSATCGAGQSFRSRRCAAADGTDAPSLSECPDPLNTGAFQSRPCSLGPCYQFTDWTTWTSCSASCDDGTVTRTRRCVDIATNIDAPTVSSCADPLNLGAFQSQPCTLRRCYSWTQWTEYSQCSATCGAGQSFRTRRCAAADGTNAPSISECRDPLNLGSFQSQPCNLGPCFEWTAWSSYSDCSQTCGAGVATRARRCTIIGGATTRPENCPDPNKYGTTETQGCTLEMCYSWTQWSSYSQCSATCGSGQIFRTRSCVGEDGSPGPQSKCVDSENIGSFQSQSCNQGPCYRLSQWGAWSSCDAPCGRGSMTRLRNCETVSGQPVPNNRCSNLNSDFIIRAICLKPACPGTYRPWMQWGECSLTCNSGVRVRTRICSTDRCIGRSREAQICNDIPCNNRPLGTWTAWSTWSSCTNPCGGTSTQTRTCIGGRTPFDCGRDCEEYSRTKTCTDCPRGGRFSIASCDVPAIARINCGEGGITAQECTARGCCYDDTTFGARIPWCFNQTAGFTGLSGRSLEGGITIPEPTPDSESGMTGHNSTTSEGDGM